MKRRSVLSGLAAGIALAACGSTAQSGGTKTGGTTTATPTPPGAKPTQATVELAKGGSFTFTLRADKAPQTVERFAGKARSGFYDNLTFHRVEDWVTQGGDPKGTGTGGERVPSEYNDLSFKLGAVGIARGQDPAFNNDSPIVHREEGLDVPRQAVHELRPGHRGHGRRRGHQDRGQDQVTIKIE